jgi:hypothetical protein
MAEKCNVDFGGTYIRNTHSSQRLSVETCPVATSSLPFLKFKKSRRNLFLGKDNHLTLIFGG